MSYEFERFAQQGWQCPICRRVYSPTTPMCYYCGNEKYTTSTTLNVGDAIIDWLHHDNVTEIEKPKKDK